MKPLLYVGKRINLLLKRKMIPFIISVLVCFSLPVAVQAADVRSATHPDQQSWYASRSISLSWDVPSDTLAVSTLYDDTADSVPRKVYVPPLYEKKLIAEDDGISYFHLQMKTENGWGEVFHYRVQIDTRAPRDMAVSFKESSVTTSPQPVILVTAQDETSGIKDILIAVDGQATTTYPVDASHSYTLPKSQPGKHVAVVTARDFAGNSTSLDIEYTVLPIESPVIAEYTKYAGSGDPLKVAGRSYPFSTVHILFTNLKTNESVAGSTDVKEDGSFLYIQTEPLSPGVYEMKARVIDQKGAESAYSVEKVVSIENTSLLRMGMFIMNWLSLVLVGILSLLFVIMTLWYSVLQFKRFKRRVYRTMQEAEHTLKINVTALRRDVEEFHTVLAKAEKKRELTKEERSMMKKFKKRLDMTEKEIEDKLAQIG